MLTLDQVMAEAKVEAAVENRRMWSGRRFSDLGELQDESFDPNVLFRNNWLARGQAFGIVAGSGIGKSSLTVQACYHWAIGRAFLADPMRPLRIAIIQAEDSDRDLMEQRDGIIHGLKTIEGWADDMVAAADRNITIPTDFAGLRGKELYAALREFQSDTRQDLIILNPVQSYFLGDLSSVEDVYEFANAIDDIIKDKTISCGFGLVMHTAKWKSGDRENRKDVTDYGEYIMAGSHGWTDWLRAIFAFQKYEGHDGYFRLSASKRGGRLRWAKPNGERTTSKIMKHSDGFIYWQEVTDQVEIDALKSKSLSPGRPAKEVLDIKAAADSVANFYPEKCKGKTRDEFAELLWNEHGRRHARSDWAAVFQHIVDNSSTYELEVVRSVSGNGKTVVTLR